MPRNLEVDVVLLAKIVAELTASVGTLVSVLRSCDPGNPDMAGHLAELNATLLELDESVSRLVESFKPKAE